MESVIYTGRTTDGWPCLPHPARSRIAASTDKGETAGAQRSARAPASGGNSDHDEKKVSLGVKQLWDDPWGTLLDKYKPGAVIDEVLVLSVTEYGAFVRIEEGVEAIVMGNDMGNELPKAGDKVKAEVSNIDAMDRRITMTMRNVGGTPQADQFNAMKRETSGKTATLGDLLKAKLGDKLSAMTGEADAAEAAPEAEAAAPEAAAEAPAEAEAKAPEGDATPE